MTDRGVAGRGSRIEQSSMRRVGATAFIATALETYDVLLYGMMGALVLGPLFLPPGTEPLVGTLAAAAGFLAGPLGTLVLAHYGDRRGRRPVLAFALVLTGVATACIGLFPTDGSLGTWSLALLLALRALSGIGAGAQFAGAVLIAIEHSRAARRGLSGGWPSAGVQGGVLLSTGAFALATSLPENDFMAWGWRVPFLLSVVLVGVGLFVRRGVAETPAFRTVKETGTESRLPVSDLLRGQLRRLLLVVGALLAGNAAGHIYSGFVLLYGTAYLGLSRGTVMTGLTIAAAVSLLTIPGFAALSDRVGRRPVYLFGAVSSAAWAFPFFVLVNTEQPPLVWLAIAVAAVGGAAMAGPQGAFFAELFSTRVRYTGIAVGRGLGSVVGGVSPLVTTALLAASGGEPWLVATYLVAVSSITVLAIAIAPETRGVDVAARPGARAATT